MTDLESLRKLALEADNGIVEHSLFVANFDSKVALELIERCKLAEKVVEAARFCNKVHGCTVDVHLALAVYADARKGENNAK